MNDFTSVKIYGGPRANYELVYFEDRRQWFIRATNRTTGAQEYSQGGYDTKREAAQAFEGQVTYVAEPPGKE